MALFKKYVTSIMAFFIPFTCVTLCQFYSITSHVLFTKTTNYGMREKKIFCIYSCFGISHHCLLQFYIEKTVSFEKMVWGKGAGTSLVSQCLWPCILTRFLILSNNSLALFESISLSTNIFDWVWWDRLFPLTLILISAT